MKLNLPSTWTQQKISTLFLLTFLKVNKVKAGQGFNACLHYDNLDNAYNKNAYDYLSNFSFNNNAIIKNNGVLYFCCDNGTECSLSSQLDCSNNDDTSSTSFFCRKVGQTIFCDGNNCGGIVGNNPITENSTIGACPELSATANYLASTPQYQNEPGSLSIHWECQNNSTICWNLGWCNWDNAGWTCDSFTKRNHTFDNTNKDCILQWTASTPFPVDSSPIPALANNSIIATPLPNNPYLVEEITLPVGAVVVGSLSGLTYYLLRKKKAKTQQQIQNSEEIELTTLKKGRPFLNNNISQYSNEELINQKPEQKQFKPDERHFEKPYEEFQNLVEIPTK